MENNTEKHKNYSKEDWYGVISALNPDRISQKENQWKIQWERVNRWLERCHKILDKSKKEKLTMDDIDILISFFQNCYHLRYWISTSRPDKQKQIEKLFKEHFEMGACRDICNGFKHKKLSKTTYDANFALFREYDHFLTEAKPSENAMIYNIVFDDRDKIRKYNIFDLAQKCFNIWDQFIKENLLLTNQSR